MVVVNISQISGPREEFYKMVEIKCHCNIANRFYYPFHETTRSAQLIQELDDNVLRIRRQ